MKEKTAVLHLTHTDIFDDNRILKELEALADSNLYEVFALGVRDSGGGARTEQFVSARVSLLNLFSKKFLYLPRFLRHAFNLVELFFPMLVRGGWFRPAIVHCHDTLVLPIGFLISWLTGASLVYDAHELESNKNGQSKILSRVTLFIERVCWRRIDTLISVSTSILSWYELNLGRKRSALVLNAPVTSVDFSHTGEGREGGYFRRKYNIACSDKVFVYLGMLEDGRGIRILLEAFRDPKVSSHVVFIGHGSLSAEISDVASEYSNIHLHKPVPHEEVVGLVKDADYGLCIVENVSLSDFFCLPNKLFEYCFAGLPVLASNFPDISDVVAKHRLGLVADVNARSVIQTIEEIQKNPIVFEPDDIEKLSWHAQASNLLHAYEDLVLEKRT